MGRFDDLSPYTYDWRAERNPDPTVVNIGWLDIAEPFEREEASAEVIGKLTWLIANYTVNLYRGSHRCWCGKAQSNGEIRVKLHGITYVAPWMIHHYVTKHQYLPPQVFIDAVLQGEPQPGTHD